MALEFNVTNIEKTSKGYIARIRFRGSEENYLIISNGILLYKGIDSENGFMMCTMENRILENREIDEITLKVEGISNGARDKAKELEKVLVRFMRNQ